MRSSIYIYIDVCVYTTFLFKMCIHLFEIILYEKKKQEKIKN
jgi:hypothetical protein